MLFAGGRLFGHISTTRCEFISSASLRLTSVAFGDMFFKELNTGYAKYVFRWSNVTRMTMERFYPLIKTPPYLTAMPEITRYERTEHDRFLIIASDGVWGLKGVTTAWAIETSEKGAERGLDPAKYLMDEVLKLCPGDDVTIIVVVFSNAPEPPDGESEKPSSA
jgi:serine/threonine protein phosphatase PrpC